MRTSKRQIKKRLRQEILRFVNPNVRVSVRRKTVYQYENVHRFKIGVRAWTVYVFERGTDPKMFGWIFEYIEWNEIVDVVYECLLKRKIEWLRDRVLFIKHAKQFTYKDMLEQTAISDDIGFKADMVFIDPYNALKIESKKNGHEYHYEAIEDMRIYCMTTGKSIFLNCHTVTEAQRVKPDQDGEVKPPIMADVEGGGKFPNKSDDVWVIHRNLWSRMEEQRSVTHLYIGKVRNTEGGGKPTGFAEPIKFTFKHDWTGFTCEGDERREPIRDFTETERPF